MGLGALIGEKQPREEPRPARRARGEARPRPEARPFPCLASGELQPPLLGKVRDRGERGSPAFPGDFFLIFS